ncbi:helix-turn-helix domain-containing protein [Desulforamulus hydrothermalis]|uniref:HTH cro/C1-type domain-containing protein n=1 Tax=Desulforamulus hydrothermalis Lam5 = DSM 18033 TaxID=1121428 RepID=K8DZ17_9FIRM
MESKMLKEKFGQRLRLLREEKKLTLEEVAQGTGTTKGTIHKYENGLREPKLSNVKAIAKFFNCDFNWLIGYSDERYPELTSNELLEIFNSLSPDKRKELYSYAQYLLNKEEH